MPGKSTRLRATEVRDVMRLVGEVRELGRDPTAWRSHAAMRLMGLTGAVVAFSLQARFSSSGPTVMMLTDIGWESPAQRNAFYGWLASPEFPHDPYMLVMNQLGNSTFVGERRRFVDDEKWYPAVTVSDVRRIAGVDDCLISSVLLPDGSVDQISLQGPWQGTHFRRHHAALVSIYHHELRRIWFASAQRQAPIDRLPDYLRRTFEKLVAGASEKEAAMQLGVTTSTLHSYVKQLYVRLDVKSRGGLITRFGGYDFAPRLGPPSN
jgi:Bacterial regulatory proteins, luxR family